MRTIPRVLSIAGTDPTGGAGIQADLKSISANGGYGMAVVTALVAQNTAGVRSVHRPPVAFLREQLLAVSDDVHIDAVKIGMLSSVPVIDEVGAWLDRVRPPIVVLDPVMVATSGDRLLDAQAESALRGLLARAQICTPNLTELAVLAECGLARTWVEALDQAHAVSARHGLLVLVTGGHLGGDESPDALVDATGGLAGGRTHSELVGERVPTKNTHGTGCSLSSALATRQAQLGDWELALADAKTWLTESLRHADELEVGRGNGPIHHFAGLWRAAGSAPTAPNDSDAPAGSVKPAASAPYASLRERWWHDIRDLRSAIDELDFIRELRAGTLSRQTFAYYLAQDALYLRGYSQALSRASQLAPTTDEQVFWAESAHGCLAVEMELHRDWLGEQAAPTEPDEVTTNYLNHLHAAAGGASYGVLVAALLPCFWIYQDVGERLHEVGHPGHPFADWLDTYADPAFAAATERAIELTERAAERVTDIERAEMWRAYRASATHEVAFFDMATRPTRGNPIL